MKKINAFFIPIFLIAMFSCCPNEEHTKNITVNPNLTMSSLKVIPSEGTIFLGDNIELYAPENALDANIYYEIAVGTSCPEPTEKSTKYEGRFTLSDKNLSVENDTFITLKILAVKTGFDPSTTVRYWKFSDGSAAVIDDNAYLESVAISNVSFDFSSEKFVYNDIKVPNDVENVNIEYKKSNTNAIVETSPSSLGNISLTAGETTQVILTVTSPDKTKMKRYLFSIYRGSSTEDIKSNDCSLSSLSVTGASIDFNKTKLTYEVTLPNSTEKTTVKYSLSNSRATAAPILSDLENISLATGETKTVSITVTAEDGTTQTYKVTIYRQQAEGQKSTDATLKSLSVTGASLSFDSSKTDYDVEIPAGHAGNVSVMYEKNHTGATVIAIPSNLGTISVVEGSSTKVTIIVTAEDAVTSKTYTINLTRQARAQSSNANLKSITLSAGSLSFNAATTSYSVSVANSVASVTVTAEAENSNANVTITPSSSVPLTAGSTTPITIEVIAEDGTPKTYTISVTRAASSGGGGGQGEEPIQTQYYWTNKDGAVGTNKTISTLSSWTEKEKIIQSVACDTPRCWLGGHEYPDPDLYAMFAAWDDINLYLMIEIPNVDDADAIDNDKSYAGSQFLPMGIVMNTGKRTAGNGTLTNGNSVWQEKNLYSWKAIDTMLMFHPRLNIGEPSVFLTDSTGKFTYDDKTLCIGFELAGVERNIYFNESVSANMWAAVVDSEGNWGGKKSTDMTTYTYVDYKASGKKMTAYQVTVPLKTIGIDKSYIETVGISVGAFSTYGASAMDCLPWDECMIDCAAESYSSDPSSSKEKEDIDEISTKLGRVGHM